MIALALALTLVPALGLDAGAPPATRDALRSPWYEVRAAAEAALAALPFAAGLERAEALLGDTDASVRRAAIEWYRLQMRLGREAEFDARLRGRILERFGAERDRLTRQRFLDLLAEFTGDDAGLAALARQGRIAPDELDRIADARLVRACERVMHKGGVPGFFDGQFRDMLASAETALARIVAYAWDPRLHAVPRTLMIMALHEPRPSQLRAYLEPLLLDPEFEVRIQHASKWDRDTTSEERRLELRARFSQYARFALAKAGVAAPIEAKVEVLRRHADEWLRSEARRLRKLEDLRGSPQAALFPSGDGNPSFELEEAMDFVFEVGYHLQQLDRYADAELAYREVVECGQPVRVRRWVHYNLACMRALGGDVDGALAELGRAVEHGFSDFSWAERDGDLAALRDDPRFHRLIAGLPLEPPG
jgi:hypothetical protein